MKHSDHPGHSCPFFDDGMCAPPQNITQPRECTLAIGTFEDCNVFPVLQEDLRRLGEMKDELREIPDAEGKQPSEMSDEDMLGVLQQLCIAYFTNDQGAIATLEPQATQIGEELNRRGGPAEMRRIFERLGGRRGSRTLEMHWDGIGDWIG